jgi:hypothetical protein
MNHDIPASAVRVSEEDFVRAINRYDYRRDGWANCIVYLDRYRGFVIGYEADVWPRANGPEYFLSANEAAIRS